MNDRLNLAGIVWADARQIAGGGMTFRDIARVALSIADALITESRGRGRQSTLPESLEGAPAAMFERHPVEDALTEHEVDAAVDYVRERVAGTPHAFKDSKGGR